MLKVNMLDYKAAIGYLFQIRERIRAVDLAGLYEYCYPKIAASENAITEWEDSQMVSLPKQYKNFLLAADGWKNVSQDKSLFGLNDLSLASDSKYVKRLDYCVDNLDSTGDIKYLLPIGAAEYANDLYLLVLDKSSSFYGNVIWAAGEEIERYNDFDDFFLSLIAYSKYDYKLFTGIDYIE